MVVEHFSLLFVVVLLLWLHLSIFPFHHPNTKAPLRESFKILVKINFFFSISIQQQQQQNEGAKATSKINIS